jgi:hypothetical protein
MRWVILQLLKLTIPVNVQYSTRLKALIPKQCAKIVGIGNTVFYCRLRDNKAICEQSSKGPIRQLTDGAFFLSH